MPWYVQLASQGYGLASKEGQGSTAKRMSHTWQPQALHVRPPILAGVVQTPGEVQLAEWRQLKCMLRHRDSLWEGCTTGNAVTTLQTGRRRLGIIQLQQPWLVLPSTGHTYAEMQVHSAEKKRHAAPATLLAHTHNAQRNGLPLSMGGVKYGRPCQGGTVGRKAGGSVPSPHEVRGDTSLLRMQVSRAASQAAR